MAITRRVARPLLASIFVVGGLDAVRNPAAKADKAKTVTEPLSQRIGALPQDPEALVRMNGAIQVGAGLLLASGRFRRLASLVLMGSIVPTTLAGHRFWEESDPAARAQQQIQFVKNVSLFGGLLLAAFDTEGEPSLGWRTKRRAHQLETAMALKRAASLAKANSAVEVSRASASHASDTSARAVRQGGAAARRTRGWMTARGRGSARKVAAAGTAAAQLASSAGQQGLDYVNEAAEIARAQSGPISDAINHGSSMTLKTVRQLEPLIQSAIEGGVDLTGPYLTSSVEKVSAAADGLKKHYLNS